MTARVSHSVHPRRPAGCSFKISDFCFTFNELLSFIYLVFLNFYKPASTPSKTQRVWDVIYLGKTTGINPGTLKYILKGKFV